MQEIWKDIVGYEGFYQISNFGNVKSLSRKCGTKSKKYTCQERILKKRETCGYYSVMLYKDGKTKQLKCSRLVAQAFIPNPNNLPCVNHKDENKHNDIVSNLEWCTVKYNSNYGLVKEKIRLSRLGTTATEETKYKMSLAHSGSRNGMFGKKHTELSKKLMSDKVKIAWKEGKYSAKKKSP